MSSYSKVRKEIAQQQVDTGPPCRECKGSAAAETLSSYGGRCGACHAAYCRAPRTWPDVGDKRKGPRDWAHALKRRHEAGDNLTPAQVDAYQTALRHGVTP